MDRKICKFLSLATLFMLFLAGCGSGKTNSTNSSSNQESSLTNSTPKSDLDHSDYYDPDNLVSTSKIVNQTKLVTYEGPNLLTTSSKVEIKVENKPLFVYETRVNHARSFTYAYSTDYAPVALFDFEGQVHVDITIKDVTSITNVLIRPLAYGVLPTVKGNVISFDLEYSASYTIEYNDDYKTAIHLFANPLESDSISEEIAKDNPDILYLGPGIYSADAIPTKDDLTIYLAGGAYVYGQIRAEKYSNLTIRGRGILAGDIYDRKTEAQFFLPIELKECSNILIEGITILDPAGWAITIYQCDNVTISNVKIITARANGDGISLQSSSNVNVYGGFVRTWDDSLVVKNSNTTKQMNENTRVSTSNILFDNVIVWTDLAQSMEVGYETNGPSMDNIVFKNIIVLHNFHKPVMSIHNCDDAKITNVAYQNITVEDGQMLGDNRNDGENDFFIDMTIAYHIDWTKTGANRGTIENVKIENVKVLKMAPTVVSRLNGESENSNIKNVTISNVQIEDKQIKTENDLKFSKNSYVSNVNVSFASTNLGAMINLPYQLNLTNKELDYKNVTFEAQNGLKVPDFACLKGDLPYVGVPYSGDFEVVSSHSSGSKASTPVSDGSGVFEETGHEANKLLDDDLSTYYKSGTWQNIDREFAGLTFEFDQPRYVGMIRLFGLEDNLYYYEFEIQVWGRKVTSGVPAEKYTTISTNKFVMSPSSGNIIDIKFTANNFIGLQLRIYHNSGVKEALSIELAEAKFYSPSLSYNKAIVDSTQHADVYTVSNLVDGDTNTYYESATMPAMVVIDLKDIYSIGYIVLHLPPSLKWDAREQTIEILASNQNIGYTEAGINFTTIVPVTKYMFNPTSGNMVILSLATKIDARFVKLVFTTNSNQGGVGAQMSEVNIY